MTDPEQRIRAKLAEMYLPEGVEIWLHSRHSWLNGRRAIDLIDAGQAGQVEAAVDRLVGGAYS